MLGDESIEDLPVLWQAYQFVLEADASGERSDQTADLYQKAFDMAQDEAMETFEKRHDSAVLERWIQVKLSEAECRGEISRAKEAIQQACSWWPSSTAAWKLLAETCGKDHDETGEFKALQQYLELVDKSSLSLQEQNSVRSLGFRRDALARKLGST